MIKSRNFITGMAGYLETDILKPHSLTFPLTNAGKKSIV